MINSLELKNITKFKKKLILDDISLKVLQGEVVGIVGHNGSGKSSLFKVISGVWKQSSGDILINDCSIKPTDLSIYKKISSFIEHPNIYGNLTVKENFDVLCSLYKIENLEWFEFLVDSFKIREFENKKLKKCSIGMKQKVGIVMSLMNNGDIVLLDEPSNSLDIEGVKVLHDIISVLRKNNKIILVSSHIIEELESLVDRVIILGNGKIRDNYNKNADGKIYRVAFKHNISKDQLTNLDTINHIYSVDNKECEISIENISEFINDCIKNNIEVENLNQSNNLLKRIIIKDGD